MTLIIFIAILLILVLSHEAGHFFTAKFFGIKVEEFGFGIPPRIAGIKKGETLYSLNLLPFGGFVKIFGEDSPRSSESGAGGQNKGDNRSFGSKNAWQKSAVLLSGVVANIFLAFVIFAFVSFLGMPRGLSQEEASFYPDARIAIVDVVLGSPAYSAGIQPGDKIKSIAGNIPKSMEEAQEIIRKNKGRNILMELQRNGDMVGLNVTPRVESPDGEGPLGIALSWVRIEKSSWYKAPLEGVKITYNTFLGTVVGFSSAVKNLFAGQTQNIQVSGPVGIFNITKDVSRSGFNMLLMLVGILSVNLAIINVIPFPGLDGGRFLFVILESIRRKPISAKFGAVFHSIGLAILLALMIAITLRDVSRIF
ncbi:MAG: site-2 protease family protein [Patescibacteria group bacterium]